ncbi:sulfur carrier protein ThiS [Bariatricus sp. SGI.154]|uniref:sulfur carrier protein ThiS n=1 Tax=Bariatricus sp. SGI.154 TaxID=3420549 RepID=UPI003CFF628C
MITVNGQDVILNQPITVAEYLRQHQYQINRIAVEMNGAILPKSQYTSVILKDGDKLEVVSFVGGG